MRKHNSGFCQECGAWRDSLHRDHGVPRWKGGGDDEDNIQYLCANCHEEKTRVDLMGRRNSDEAIARSKAFHIGRKRTPEAKERMSEAARGKEISADTRASISASLTGKKRKPFSDEHRANMRLAAQRRGGRVAVSVPSTEDLLK